MTSVEWIAFGGTMATILGVFDGVYALINNRVIRSEMAATRLILDKMAQGLKKMSQGQEKIAELIVADGERTRDLVRQLKSP